MTRSRYQWRSLIVATVALALAAAGCGGDSSESSPSAEEWANGVCGAITTWTDSITSAAQSLQESGVSESALESAVDDVKSASETLVDDIDALGVPDTEDGTKAKEAIDQMGTDVQDGAETIQSAFDDASGVAGILTAVGVVGQALTTMQTQISSSLKTLEQLDPGGELQDAFDNADSCKAS
jgi:hypothetical protein